jgi:hypothetical protein
LVAFLVSLTDERVRYERAPFDHPQLFITNGHPGDQNAVTNDGTGQATTTVIELPAVGRNGTNCSSTKLLGRFLAAIADNDYSAIYSAILNEST